jgi:hypothetical protein
VRLGNLAFVIDGSHFWYRGVRQPGGRGLRRGAAALAGRWDAGRPRLSPQPPSGSDTAPATGAYATGGAVLRAVLLAPAALAPLALTEALGPARPVFVAAIAGVLVFLATERDGAARLRARSRCRVDRPAKLLHGHDLFVTHAMLPRPAPAAGRGCCQDDGHCCWDDRRPACHQPRPAAGITPATGGGPSSGAMLSAAPWVVLAAAPGAGDIWTESIPRGADTHRRPVTQATRSTAVDTRARRAGPIRRSIEVMPQVQF